MEDNNKNISFSYCSMVDLYNPINNPWYHIIIDIRTPQEFKLNHINSSFNLNFNLEAKQLKKKLKRELQNKWNDKIKTIYIYASKSLISSKTYIQHITNLLNIKSKTIQSYITKPIFFLSNNFIEFQSEFPFLCSNDNNINPLYPNMILTNKLYLGDLIIAKDKTKLINLNIKYIINITTIDNFYENDKELNIKYKQIKILDEVKCNIYQYFNNAIYFISQNINKGKILVHCEQGISRSASIIIAYLMKTCKISYENAFEFVKDKRPQISPNKGFIVQLKKFESVLFVNESNKLNDLLDVISIQKNILLFLIEKKYNKQGINVLNKLKLINKQWCKIVKSIK